MRVVEEVGDEELGVGLIGLLISECEVGLTLM